MRMQRSNNVLVRIAMLMVVFAMAGGSLFASVVDNFNAYPGSAGNGWSGEWTASAGSISGSVASSSELNGNGSYLRGTMEPTGTQEAFLSRTWDNAAVNKSGTITISWDWRLDAALTSDTRIQFNEGGAANSSFIIVAYGPSVGGGLPGNEFMFYNGTQNSAWNNANLTNSGMQIVAGTVYTFTVNLDPSTKTWTATIFNGTDSVTSGTLGFRGDVSTVLGTLNFGAQARNTHKYEFSMDNLTVAIPEPASIGLFLISGGFIFLMRHVR
ncbi:MAG: PEP-CTERM sorting domain-containing protein [Kiritimatiellales bacterium]